VYAGQRERDGIAAVARQAGVPFVGLWLDGPVELLSSRIRSRSADPSDATVEVLERQAQSDLGHLEWQRLDASLDIGIVQQHAAALIPTT
jgi:predicted kinase